MAVERGSIEVVASSLVMLQYHVVAYLGTSTRVAVSPALNQHVKTSAGDWPWPWSSWLLKTFQWPRACGRLVTWHDAPLPADFGSASIGFHKKAGVQLVDPSLVNVVSRYSPHLICQ